MNDSFLIDLVDSLTPVEAAEASLADDPVKPAATVRYSSRGRLLVLGNHDAVDAVVDNLPTSLEVSVALAGPSRPDLSAKLSGEGVRLLNSLSGMDIFGWLGSFRLTATQNTDLEDLAPGAAFCESGFDLVLDLLEPPIARRPNPPIGYFAAALSNPEKLEEALAQLPHWVGEFDKPNYYHFDPGLCDYRSGGVETCRRCFDVCGTWAITKDETRITVNPYLCQGCGDCATVCPTGAISFNFPSPQRMLVRIERMLDAYFEHGGKVPVLLLHDGTKGRAWLGVHRDLLQVNVLPFEIEALGAVGAETWLMALAFGAAEVLLLDTGGMNEKTRTLLRTQMEWCRAILAGLGFAQQVLRMVSADEMRKASVPVHPFQPVEPLAIWPEHAGKRTLLREAIQHLRRQTSSPPLALLPAGAPFGAVQIDPDACTLCMKCVPVCPETALIGDPARKRLAFVEASCIQCGGCVRICPEEAVTLQPRYTYDLDAIAAVRSLVQK
jgi:ferredoxin